MKSFSLSLLTSFAWSLPLLTGCASSGTGADLNETATVQELAAELDVLKTKVNRALKQSATAKIDASTALAISTTEN